jgi:hypothetical protein
VKPALASSVGQIRNLVVALALSLVALRPSARAEPARVLLLPTAGDPTLAAQRAAVQRALTEGLERQAFEVVRAPEPEVGSGARRCSDAECAPALLESLGAELAVASALWGPGQVESGQTTVAVLLVDAAAEHYPAEEALAATSIDAVEAATEAALLDAQGLRLLGPGPWLEVSAVPGDAMLTLDGVRVGALPYRAAIAAGTHALALERGGVVAWQHRIDVTLGTVQLARVHVALDQRDAGGAVPVTLHGASLVTDVSRMPTGAPGPDAATDTSSEAVSPWNYALGSVLVLAGAAMLIVPLQTVVQQGDCIGEVDAAGRCAARVDAGAGTYAQLGIAVALLAGGATVFALRPLRIDVQASERRAFLELTTTF